MNIPNYIFNLHETNQNYLLKLIIALNSFKDFLMDDTVEIDYEYLWDIICMPRIGKTKIGGLFDHGIKSSYFEKS